ncbi:MAG: Ca-activated chloride channel [Blastocatellia bacterium]|jgi:Ca-activated chloride channel family protein|nr:Ca-activated chloride channel [Blastocatellia bacterium]
MKRNPLLRSILFAFVCLLVTGEISRDHFVMAQGAATEGSLMAVDGSGKPAGPCPLKHTDVKTEISGSLARVIVTQQFENPFPDKIEAVYTFPLPSAAAIDDMTITVGNRTVKGKIMRREEAQATYDAARAGGQVAALLHQQRPNIFTQAVANILPGQQINVTISYVETLKYDAGSYEWSFPMVVGARYIPAAANDNSGSTAANAPERAGANAQPEAAARVRDAALISPPQVSEGMRPGHDISIEVNIDSGVPLIGFQSATHEIEALQPGQGKATVRLKDQASVPNRDFVLKYEVAGNQIEDALLTHRGAGGGFFTFILQPPARVTVADVTPKELVFVLDTSGSMEGFPLDKAKETMRLALDGLYPQDTFNVITFAGDTRILFKEPVAATPANLKKAKELLTRTQSDGGTEMMKAIRAALAPSDDADHVRITCFLTDGQVGNDMEIIAEVQKHPKARVFALGFGDANRFLLDKITEYGRGEVEYVTENGDSSGVAKRFHERVRNPLLTDVTIDWGGLAVNSVYPQTIPDLFSAQPVVISGRYATPGTGVIRLKGMMSGREFVREIPVSLPDNEPQHDVLLTLWARRKVDDLTGRDMQGMQTGTMKEELKTEITNLGLTYRMMTQFTSFVAVEDTSVTDGGEPRRVDVPVASTANVSGPAGAITSVVNVIDTSSSVNTSNSSISSTVTQQSLQNLPLNGRSVQGLLLLAPGTVSPGRATAAASDVVSISVNGEGPASNGFILDGISANVGIAPGGQSPGSSASGNGPALTATGGTTSISAVDSVREVNITTHGFAPEYGRSTGGLFSVITKSGTNEFHGSTYYAFNHEALDANDWFANSRALAKPRHRMNEFGGNIGGPLQRDHWFFFSSYEGLRLHQPVVALTDVPSVAARLTAPASVWPLLNLYPLPTGPARPDGFAEFASSFANQGKQNTASLSINGHPNDQLTLGGHFSFTNSHADERGAGEFSLNTLNRVANRSALITGNVDYVISPRVVAELKLNYSRFTSRSSYALDSFGGAVVPLTSNFLTPGFFGDGTSFSADLNARSSKLLRGAGVGSTQRQLNLLGAVTMVSGTHSLKFGADYRRLFPIIGLRPEEQTVLFDGVTQALSGTAARVNLLTRSSAQTPVFDNFAAFGQDEWRITPKLTLNYGLRWELSPAPHASDQRNALAVNQVEDPAPLTVTPQRTRLWQTTYGNLAPRLSIAYQPLHDDGLVLRGSFIVLYDTGNGAVGDAYADSYPFLNIQSQANVPFSFASAPASANSGAAILAPFLAFDPHMKTPYTLRWSAEVARSLGSAQTISLAYVGGAGRRLWVTNTFLHQNSDFDFLRLTDNDGSSTYRSLQVAFNRRFSKGLGAMASYTWGKSEDNVSQDSPALALFRSSNSQVERAPSDFDIRHTLNGFVSYGPPPPFASGWRNLLTRKWLLDASFSVRSAPPVNVVYGIPTSLGFLYLRPDVIPGAPLYLDDAAAAGGRRINAAAFSVPQEFRQGTLDRNTLRGYMLSQVNLALRRRFNFSESVTLTLGAEATNVFNHPNFAAPSGNEASLGTRFAPSATLQANTSFGQSYTNAARSSTGIAGSSFGANYYPGGARTVKLTAKFEF